MRLPLALVFAIIATLAQAADLACVPVKLTCSGFEPNWRFVLPGNNTIRFTDPENPNWQTQPLVLASCAQPRGKGFAISAGALLNLTATVTRKRCIEPNERVRKFTIAISYRQGASGGTPAQVDGTGCCWR